MLLCRTTMQKKKKKTDFQAQIKLSGFPKVRTEHMSKAKIQGGRNKPYLYTYIEK